MAISHLKAKTRPTGGKHKQFRKKKHYETGRMPSLTKIDKPRKKTVRTMGNDKKVRLLGADTANLYDPKAKKYEKVKIKTIAENPANRHFTRRNILTKGAVIETEKGKAKVTSRPGQDGVVNAVLIS